MAYEPPRHPGRTIARLARQVELAVSSLDLTLSQYRVLGILGDGHEAASVLADKLAVSRPSVTGVVDGLVARGLVIRDHHGADRRRIDVGLTDEGRRLLAAADAEVQGRLGEIARYLEPEPESSGGPGEAFGALATWHVALDAYRTARHAQRKGLSKEAHVGS
jgi:long-chain acyl-CoA synthetase